MDKIPVTTKGFAAMEAEVKKLMTVDRVAVIEAISEARAHGDLKENAEYHAAKEKQSFIEGRIRDIGDKMARAEVIDVSKLSGDKVLFGATVTLVDENTEEKVTYQIVGDYEADITKGLISINAPIARALVGKKQGASVEVKTPKGEKSYEIVKVEFK
jgi:transcription elongation factor GreA